MQSNMKVWINGVEPIIGKRLSAVYHEFIVDRWRVEGSFLHDENECRCGAIPFIVEIQIDSMKEKKTSILLLTEKAIKEKYAQ